MDWQDKINKAEYERIKAETAKIREEKKRVEFENQEYLRKQDTPFFKSKEFYKTFLGLVLGIPLVFTYVKLFIIPALEVDKIKLSQDLVNQETQLNASIKEKQQLLDSINELSSLTRRSAALRYLKELTSNELNTIKNRQDIDRKLNFLRDKFQYNLAVLQEKDTAELFVDQESSFRFIIHSFNSYDPEAPTAAFMKNVVQSQLDSMFYELGRPLQPLKEKFTP